MADKAVERTQEWRKEMREKGYELTHIWLKITDKRLIQDKARQRHQSLAECIMDGIRVLPPVTRQSGPSTVELATRVARLEQLYEGNTVAVDGVSSQTEEMLPIRYIDPASLESTSTPPHEGWIPCKNQLHWKAPKGECVLCKKARRQRNK